LAENYSSRAHSHCAVSVSKPVVVYARWKWDCYFEHCAGSGLKCFLQADSASGKLSNRAKYLTPQYASYNLQSPTKTTAGTGVGGFDAFYDYADQMSPLGNASAEDCANYTVMLFSDLTRMVTMQNLYHDGGFSSTGISQVVIEKFGSK